MALATRELFQSSDRDPYPRVMADQDGVKVCMFAAVGAAPEYAALTPVAFNTATAKWVIWASGGANETGIVRGFVYPDAVQTDAADDVHGQVMTHGIVHYDDVVLPAGQLQADLATALKAPATRGVGLKVQGLEGIRY